MMRNSTQIIWDVLNCDTFEQARVWESRAEDWDSPDWSEMSMSELHQHIKNFVLDWINVYEKAENSIRTVHLNGSGGAPVSLSDQVVAPPRPLLKGAN